MDEAEFNKACLRIHGYNFSSSDEGKSESDEESRKLKPPPIPYEAFKDKIIRLDENYMTIQSNAVATNLSVVNGNKKKSRSKKKNIAQIDNSTPSSNVPKANPQEFVKEIPQYLHGNRNQIKDKIFTTESSATAYNLQRSVSTQFTPTTPDRQYLITNAPSFMQIEYSERPASNSLNNLNRPINYAGVLNSPIINPGRNVIPVVEQPSAAPNRFTPNIPTERDLCSSIGNIGNFGGSLTPGVDNSSRSERSLRERSTTNISDNASLQTQNTIIQTQQNESVTLPNHDNDNILLFERDNRSCCSCCTIS